MLLGRSRLISRRGNKTGAIFCSSFVLSSLFFAVSAHGNAIVKVRESLVTLPLTRRLNLNGTTIADLDRARIAHLMDAGANIDPGRRKFRRQSSFEVTNAAVLYTADVGIGSPPTTYSLIVDTGNRITWVGADKTFVPTSSSHKTGRNVSGNFGVGFFEGVEYLDTVTLSQELIIANQSIGVALNSSGFSGLDGLLALGPVGLTNGKSEGEETVPTVTKNLFKQGTISEEVLSVFFAPTTKESVVNGFLTFGGVDKSKTTSDVSYVPVTKTQPASRYWGVNQTVTYGSNGETILPNSAGIVDTGATLFLMENDAFNKYLSLTGAAMDDSTGLLKISNTDYDKLQSLFFHIGDQTYEFTANAQTWPRSLNTDINGAADGIYLVVASFRESRNPGFTFINGYVFLERFYSVYDATNNRVGLATTAFTYDNNN